MIWKTHPLVHKPTSVWLPSDYTNLSGEAEPSVFVWKGKLYEACVLPPYAVLRIRHYQSARYPVAGANETPQTPGGQIVSGFALSDLMISVANVDDTTLHIFGMSNGGAVGNTLRHWTMTDVLSPPEPADPHVILGPIAGKGIYNSGVCEYQGDYFCAVEVACEVALILKSTDAGLNNWTQVGAFYPPRGYIGAVGLKSGRGGLYLHYCVPLSLDYPIPSGNYGTVMANSRDGGQTWTVYDKDNLILPLAPDTAIDGVNTTDLDLCDWQGGCAMAYFGGNQMSAEAFDHHINSAWFPGSVQDFCELFFPFTP